LIPEKLYGRAREVETLLAAFDRVVESGAPELVLVSGHPGIGKSSVVNELHKVIVLHDIVTENHKVSSKRRPDLFKLTTLAGFAQIPFGLYG
jgi:predicted ATPase